MCEKSVSKVAPFKNWLSLLQTICCLVLCFLTIYAVRISADNTLPEIVLSKVALSEGVPSEAVLSINELSLDKVELAVANYNYNAPLLVVAVNSPPLSNGTAKKRKAPKPLPPLSQGLLSKEEDGLEVLIKYPVTGSQLIDLELQAWATGQMRTFVLEAQGFREDDGDSHIKYALNIDYKTFQTPATFSVLFNVSAYTGGAHPGDGQISFVFKLDDSSRLTLLDVFQADKQAIAEHLASLCRNALRNDLGKLGVDVPNESIPAELDNFSAFVIDKVGVIISFEPYQVAPYSFGYQTVVISLKDLEALKPRLELWQKL